MLLVAPLYLAVLLLIKAMHSVGAVVRPLAMMLPAWVPAEHVLSLLLVVLVCCLIGMAVRTRAGQALRERMETAMFDRLPGYALVRSLTQRLAGQGEEHAWQLSSRWPWRGCSLWSTRTWVSRVEAVAPVLDDLWVSRPCAGRGGTPPVAWHEAERECITTSVIPACLLENSDATPSNAGTRLCSWARNSFVQA